MIKLDRPSPTRSFLESSFRERQRGRIQDWFSKPRDKRGERQFGPRWANAIPGFMDEFRKIFANKCAYCEIKLDNEPDEAVLAFFRPTEGAIQLNGAVASDHYWWLSWEWSNLYLACPTCIRSKHKKFPTKRNRAHPNTYGDNLLGEQPLLLDPCLDDPLEHLRFLETGEVVARNRSERGKATIDILDLNREELILARSEYAKSLRGLLFTNSGSPFVQLNVSHLASSLTVDQPYLGMTLDLLGEWIEELPQLKPVIAAIVAKLPGRELTEFESNQINETKRKRSEVIEEYLTLEKELKNQSFHQAFLSIDLAGATKMKVGQDALQVELSFREYHFFLESILKGHAVFRSTWAGDGSMSSFDESQHAVDAAIKFLENLGNFNREQNRLATPFSPRCGIHSGTVHADRSTPIEEIFSSVIDIAGHLQKRAEANGLLISEATFDEIQNRSNFRMVSFEVDGQRAWSYLGSGDQPREYQSGRREDQRSVARQILVSLYEAWAAHTIISLNPICEEHGWEKAAFRGVVDRLEKKHGLIRNYGSSYSFEITPAGVLYVEDNNLLSSSKIDLHRQIRHHVLNFLAVLYEREGVLADAHYEKIAEGGPVNALDMLTDLSLLGNLGYVKNTSINTFRITDDGLTYYRGADYQDIV